LKNNTHVVRTSRNKMSTTWDLYCCLARQCGKFCELAAQPFQSQQSGALTGMRRWCQVQPSHKELAIGAVNCKNEGMFLQLLGWRCIESVVFACPIHENDQRYTCRLLGFGIKSCDISICCRIWMLSFLLKQIWIGIDYFPLKFFATFRSVLRLQNT